MAFSLSEKNCRYRCLGMIFAITVKFSAGVMVHPLGDYACQPKESSVVAHALTAWYYMNGASYTNGATQTISEGAAKVTFIYDPT